MRTIDADALTASLKESADRCHDWIQECINIKDDVTQRLAEQSLLTFNECCLRIKKMPTIEPQRMRGRWIPQGWNDTYCKCSCCDAVYVTAKIPYNFCPNCGADMRGGQDETN